MNACCDEDSHGSDTAVYLRATILKAAHIALESKSGSQSTYILEDENHTRNPSQTNESGGPDAFRSKNGLGNTTSA
jgi:hypothetical protein